MKKLVVLLFLVILFACEGKQGPMGPTGPSGATIIYITGVISNGDYEGDWIQFNNWYIEEDAVVQVYFSQDKDEYAWLFIEEFQLTRSIIYVYDPWREYLGYDYEIKIIKDSEV
ncbi:MAG: hypothetical protein B6D58_09020 [candidate division Zixibacteria bacterium 4484_95]|nr:MAG: hypothetical protein B6D58_09020 [candidate division Zixibacteria bacterium 4484_95]